MIWKKISVRVWSARTLNGKLIGTLIREKRKGVSNWQWYQGLSIALDSTQITKVLNKQKELND